MKSAYDIIVRPHITEKSMKMSYGDPTIRDDKQIVRKYTFIVATSANKLEIKAAVEAIYNAGKSKKDELIKVDNVRTMTMHGKKRRVGTRTGYRPDQKKAIITLAQGQLLEDYGV